MPRPENTLFGGDDSLFKGLARKAQHYAEYGCGASTRWVLDETSAHVRAVDTSAQWIDFVRTGHTEGPYRLDIHHVDLGEISGWGRPATYRHRDRFAEYTDWIWQGATIPDLVLIDGRFRVCCFLTCLRLAPRGTPLIFDDYTARSHYHVVEEYLKPTDLCGRQALFHAPGADALDRAKLDRDIAGFRNVMD